MRLPRLTLTVALLTLFTLPAESQEDLTATVLPTYTTCIPQSQMLNQMLKKKMDPFLKGTGMFIMAETTGEVPDPIIPLRGMMETFMDVQRKSYQVWVTVDLGAEELTSCVLLSGGGLRPHDRVLRKPTPEADPISGESIIDPTEGQAV
jgi:hypothetical protein